MQERGDEGHPHVRGDTADRQEEGKGGGGVYPYFLKAVKGTREKEGGGLGKWKYRSCRKRQCISASRKQGEQSEKEKSCGTQDSSGGCQGRNRRSFARRGNAHGERKGIVGPASRVLLHGEPDFQMELY